MIIARYDAILDQSERTHLYNHHSNYTKVVTFDGTSVRDEQWFIILESPDIFRLPLPRSDDWDFLSSSSSNWERKEQVWVDVGNLE